MKNIFAFMVFVSVSCCVHSIGVVGGIDHVGLSVTKPAATEEFFVKHVGFKTIKKDEFYPSVFLSNGSVMVTLWRVTNPEKSVKFNRKNNVGLHHLAFSVDSFESLDELYSKLKAVKNVKIQFSPELLSGGPAKHMMVYEPSGNRLEFIHRPKGMK